MDKSVRIEPVEAKRKNILYHNIEADYFEIIHPEAFSLYEKLKILKDFAFIVRSSKENELCVDVGCGTGLITSIALPRYKTVVAMDISKRMLQTVKRKFKNFNGLNLVLCDAEKLPLKSKMANMISASSVLHHLPNPSQAIAEVSRTLKNDGFFYITREPNDISYRRFFDLLNRLIINILILLPFFRTKQRKLDISKELIRRQACLALREVDVWESSGFNVEELSHFLSLNSLEVISAGSYYWIYCQFLPSRINEIIERIPFSKRFGVFVCLISKKIARAEKRA